MYTITVGTPGGDGPLIERQLSSDTEREIIPVLKEICVTEFDMITPIALYMGDHVYRIFELARPWCYSVATIVKEPD